MDWVTWGFVAVVLIFMITRFLFERRMYQNSVYRMIYTGFTEYRMRKKSIEGMAESYELRDAFGPHRILFSVIDDKKYSPASFITVFLTSGCYVFGVCSKAPGADAMSVCARFYEQNVQAKLKGTVYEAQKQPVCYRLVVPDSMAELAKKDAVIPRSSLLTSLKELHAGKSAVNSAEDVEHLFKIVAAQAIEKEEAGQLGTMLTKDR